MRFRESARRTGAIVLVTILLSPLSTPFTSVARAEDASTPLLTIAKSALLGGLVGLVLGGVTALVVESDQRDDSVRWGIVLGTFGGFAYGIYAVSRQDDEDFFGERAAGDQSLAWQRPLPGQATHAPFADLRATPPRPSVSDPFRVRASELTTVD